MTDMFSLRLQPRCTPPDRRAAGRRGDAGLMALELAILAPVFIVMLLVVVGFGRVTHARQLVDQAAAAAARAAALTSTPAQADTEARAAVASTLAQAGLSCRGVDVGVDISAFHAGGRVSTTVRCTADLSGLAIAGLPGSITLSAVGRAPLETFRDVGAAGGAP